MHTLATILLTITLFSVNAQTTKTKPAITDSKKEVKSEFKNQGEQEDHWAEQLFDKKYSKQSFDKFKGDVIINGNGFNFGDKTFIIINTPQELRTVFSSGIFYPTILTGDTKTLIKSQAELDTLSADQQVFYNMTTTDSLTISDFEELKFLSNSPKYKRFKFWLWEKGFSNPTAYFIELTNDDATDKTDLTTFIKGASLTFVQEGWIGI